MKKLPWDKIKWLLVGVILTLTPIYVNNNWSTLKQLGAGTSNKFEFEKINPEFAQYISAFTTGYISSGSTIKIKFTSQILENVPLNTPIEEELFSFDDDIEGETYWSDAQTLVFKPKQRLKAGEIYEGVFYLHKLIDVKDDLKEFKFKFKIVNQSLKVEFNDLRSYSPDDFSYYKSSGTLYTADFAERELIEKLLTAEYDGKVATIVWAHDEKNTTHNFYIDSLKRGSIMSSKLIFKWNGKEINVDENGTQEFSLPAVSDFKLLNVQVVSTPEQYVQIALSNPLDPNQSLDGLVTLGKMKDLKFIIENNHIRIYPNEVRSGEYKLNISSYIKDAKGNLLNKDYENQILFEEIKPSVNFVGSGVILPSSNGLKIPIEAVNLKAVDVEITKIFESNILQHLQENDITGSYELARVGKTIVRKRISLGITNPADFKHKKKFFIDLSAFLKAEPGALYNVSLSFKKAYSAYSCGGATNIDNIELEEIKDENEEDFGYQYYYDYYDEDYDWNQSDNPCNSAYYSSYRTTVKKNILASDMGLTVKKANDGTFFIATSNLVTAEPYSNTEIEFYNYQQQLIQSSKTNSEGHLFTSVKEKPYFIVAKSGNNKSYVKLEDGATLSLTMFDTEGETIQKGLKGFMYGERGVWRPGDTIFLTFILEDKLKNLPANHPILFELRNPQGMIYKKALKAKGLDGFYTFPVATDVNAPTGNWMAVCKVGAVEFTKNIRIETVMPNRLKIKIDVGENKIINPGNSERVNLHANWLTGITARNLKATVAVAVKPEKTEFSKYKSYIFDDPTLRYEAENITLFDGNLNQNGDASFPLNIDTKGNAPGMLKASFVTRVYETGGTFSVDRFSTTYSPYNNYIGIQLPESDKYTKIIYTGRDQKIKVASVNYKGQPVSCAKLRVQVYKLDWRWWWDQYEDELANYTSSDYHKPVYTEDISTSNGEGDFTLNIKEDDWGRYLIRVTDLEGGHSSAVTAYFDYADWMERGGSDNKIVASLLHFTTDKEAYKCEEEVVVNIPSPKGGRALITIETGSKILEAHWLETEKGNTKFKFKVTPEMAPNIYIHVSLIQPHAQTVNDLPIRLYGILPVKIDDPNTHLRPLLTMSSVLAPETVTSITVSEENEKEMTYTIAMVDEGLLDLTRFKTPDPWSKFYAREALGVKTWDIYDYVMGAYGGELERILSIGGDGTEINKDAAKTNRFKPMVKFIGPFHLKKGEKNTHSFKMPMYIGSVRTMIIAGYNGAYGFSEKTTPVKSPIMLLGTLPRVLSINENVELPVSVFGGEGNLQNVTVSIETNSLVQTVGNASQQINVNKNDEKIVNFKLKVKDKTGVAKVTIKAVCGDKKTHYSLELDVRNPNPYRTDIKEFYLDGGKDLSADYTGMGVIGTNSGVLEISSIPPINLDSRINYLVSYPYGCVEQTTSSAFAQLYLENIVSLTANKKNEVEGNIKAAISRLQQFQLADGGFSYWPGQSQVSEWNSIYVGHFILSAEKKGYAIPSAMKQNWIKYQLNLANNYESSPNKYHNSDFVQAYRLYVLALAGKAPFSAMNRLREQTNLNMQAKWCLASAFTIIGNSDVAEKVINNVPVQIPEYRVDYFTFGSSIRDEAMVLEALCLLNKKPQAFETLKKLSANLSGKKFLSTQTTAYSLMAVASFINKFGNSGAMQVQVELNGKSVSLRGNTPINVIPIDFSNTNLGTFKIQNKGKGVLYVRLINRGKPAIGNEKEEQENLIAEIKYKTESGAIIDPKQLKQGTNFVMEVIVKNPGTLGDLENIALLNYIPSGWEIHNSRMDDNEAVMKNSTYDYQDVRDDRIMTYFNLRANETKTYRFNLNASYSGSYYLPGINVEAMYDNSAFSRKKGYWVKVVK